MILIAESHQARTGDVLHALRTAGLRDVACQASIGTITGEFDDTEDGAKKRLGKVPGVATVEIAQSYRLPPEDSDIQ